MAVPPMTTSTLLAAETLFHNAGDIRISNITLHESPAYLGIYMDLHLDGLGLHVHAHCTIGHWRVPARQPLSPHYRARVLARATAALSPGGVLHFATVPPVVLDYRTILTVHVQSGLHHGLWSLHNSACQVLRTKQESRRVNFHVSVDSIF